VRNLLSHVASGESDPGPRYDDRRVADERPVKIRRHDCASRVGGADCDQRQGPAHAPASARITSKGGKLTYCVLKICEIRNVFL